MRGRERKGGEEERGGKLCGYLKGKEFWIEQLLWHDALLKRVSVSSELLCQQQFCHCFLLPPMLTSN